MAAVGTVIILRILTINSGSSSITFSRYRMDKQEEILVKGSAEGSGLARMPSRCRWLSDCDGRHRVMRTNEEGMTVRHIYALVKDRRIS